MNTKQDWCTVSVIVPTLSSALHMVLPTVRNDCRMLLQMKSAGMRERVRAKLKRKLPLGSSHGYIRKQKRAYTI